jgi:N-acetylmuramoyl-L-alanine amidase
MVLSSLNQTGVVSFNQMQYISLVPYCDTMEIHWEWDPVTNVVSVDGRSGKGRFLVDSQIAMVGGERVHLPEPLRMSQGLILFPAGSLPLLDSLSAAKAPTAVTPGPFQARKIVLDPGHGGKDPGARGRKGTKEKEIVLDVALRIRDLLAEDGVDVIMTRDKDNFIPLGKRSQMANRNKADFFVSIHANSSRSRAVSGFEVYYLSNAVDDETRAIAAMENASLNIEEDAFSGRTQDLDATLWDLVNSENRVESAELAKELEQSAQTRLGVRNRGVKSARFAVLKGATMPAVLVEVGFLTNPVEEERLRSSSYRQRLAEAITAGILKYKSRYEKTEGFTQTR